jgi:hypothetical protein
MQELCTIHLIIFHSILGWQILMGKIEMECEWKINIIGERTKKEEKLTIY